MRVLFLFLAISSISFGAATCVERAENPSEDRLITALASFPAVLNRVTAYNHVQGSLTRVVRLCYECPADSGRDCSVFTELEDRHSFVMSAKRQ